MKILKLTTLLVLTLMAHNAFSTPILNLDGSSARYSLTGLVDENVNLNMSFSFDFSYPDSLRIFDINAGLVTPDNPSVDLFAYGNNCITDCDISSNDWIYLVNNIDNTAFTVSLRFAYAPPEILLDENGDPILNVNGDPIFSEGLLTFEEHEYQSSYNYSTDVPEPATIALLASGLFGFGVARRNNKA